SFASRTSNDLFEIHDIMYCGKCGTEIADDSNFCFKCGAKVNAPIALTGSPSDPVHSASPPEQVLTEVEEERNENEHLEKEGTGQTGTAWKVIFAIGILAAIYYFYTDLPDNS